MYVLSIEVSQQSHGLGRNFQNHYVYHKSKHFSLCVLLVDWWHGIIFCYLFEDLFTDIRENKFVPLKNGQRDLIR